jgi:serine/threonine protein kinase
MSSDSAAKPSAAAPDHEKLERLGKYLIQRKLGAGGMGTVYLATDTDLRRTVALKVLPKDRAENAILVRRFKAEAQAAAQLQHKNIVGVYEASQADGLLYIALEFIDGDDALGLLRKRGVIPVKRSVEIIKQAAAALQHAFERNIVHRDIKPSNLMIARDGEVKLADMGLARSIDENIDTSITRAGTTVGTIDYMAPEQARNSKAADIRSDLYSLGCTWYHLITGQPPFGEGDVMAKVQAHAAKSPPDPRRINDRIPEAIVAVIHRLMAKKPQERYQTPQDLIDDLANPNLHRQGVTSDLLASLAHAHEEVVEEEEEVSQKAGNRPRSKPASKTRPSQTADGPYEEEDEQDSPSVKSGKPTRGPTFKPSAAKAAPGRAQRIDDPDDDEDLEEAETPASRKPTAARKPKSGSLIEQALEDEDAAVDSKAKVNRKKTSGDRALPQRMDAKEADAGFNQMSIDPAFIKIGVVGLIVLCVVGAIVYLVRSAGGNNGGDNGNLAGIVQRNQELNAQPEGPKKQPGAETPMPAPADAPPVQATVPGAQTFKFTGPTDSSPFPGVEEARATDVAVLPAWVAYTRGPAPSDIPVVKVRRYRAEPGEVTSVAGLEGRNKVVIEFQDEGPHRIPAGALAGVQWLGLLGKGVRPTVVIHGAPPAGVAALGGKGSTLKIEGVDLFWKAPAGASALFGAQSGELLVRNSTISIAGEGEPGTVWLRGSAGTLTRAVLENVVVRSDRGGGIRLEGTGVEVVAGNLLSVGAKPFLDVQAAAQAPPAAAQPRVARIYRSAILTRSELIAARHEGTKPPVPVDVKFEKSVATYVGAADAARPAIALSAWPQTSAEESTLSRAMEFRLGGERLRLAGWPILTAMESIPDPPAPVTDAVGWRLFWKQTPVSDDFQAATPAALSEFRSVQTSIPFTSLSAALKPVQDEAGESIGVDLAALPRPVEGIDEHFAAFAAKPQMPEAVVASNTGSEVRFDLRRGATFNRFLNSECPDGARVIAFGAGIRQIEPISLKGKSLTITFEQGDGAPLEIQPLSRNGSESDGPDAWLTIGEGARIEFVNARFQLLWSKAKAHPKRFARIQDGAIVLSRCQVRGPLEAENAAAILVELAGTSASKCLLRDSYLISRGAAVAIEGSGSHLRTENSILVSQGPAISLLEAARDAVVDLSSSTVASAASGIHLAKGSTGSSRLFVSYTLFAPLVGSGATVVADDASAAGKTTAWWGVGNAYSAQMPSLLVSAEHPAGKQSLDRDWSAVWGVGHDVRPATGDEAVVFVGALSRFSDLKQSEFSLRSGCLAATWGDAGGPVGANPSEVGAPESAAKPAAGTPKPMTKPQPKPVDGF